MARYRKKPIVITAEQYTKGKHIEGLEYNWDNDPRTPDKVTVSTLEGRMTVSEGDYIITGVCGEKYPCKSHVFDQTYERVEDEEIN